MSFWVELAIDRSQKPGEKGKNGMNDQEASSHQTAVDEETRWIMQIMQRIEPKVHNVSLSICLYLTSNLCNR